MKAHGLRGEQQTFCSGGDGGLMYVIMIQSDPSSNLEEKT